MTTTTPPPDLEGARGVVARASAAIAELRGVLWAARSGGEKMEMVAALEELKSRIEAIELDVIRDLDATRAPEQLGWASAKDFVTAVSGGFKGSGPAAVRLAGALEDLALAPVAEALADGWLSTAKAQVIERTVSELPAGRDGDLRAHGVQVLLGPVRFPV